MEFFFPELGLDLIDGLEFLHNNGIAHQDSKPANILVSNKHYANITDAAELNMAIKKQPNTMQTHWLWGVKVTDSSNKNCFGDTNQTYATRYFTFFWDQSSFLENVRLNKQSKKI